MGERMSLAYKLWKIGSVLNEKEIKEMMEDHPEDGDQSYVNIDFKIEEDKVVDIIYREEAIDKGKMFFSKKIGGSGSGMYYLYPNLKIQGETLEKKVTQLANTINRSILLFSRGKNREYAELINEYFQKITFYKDFALSQNEIESLTVQSEKTELELKEKEKYLKSIEKEYKSLDKIKKKLDKEKTVLDPIFLDVIARCLKKQKDNYWFWISINGKTFPEIMEEVWDNWYRIPVIKNEDSQDDQYDIFTNKQIKECYRPEIKVFSYDNYHDSLSDRINKNLSLSLESAKNIKFAWIYVLNHLVFRYKGLEYIILPSVFSDDQSVMNVVLKRFKKANEKTLNKKTVLEKLRKEEKKLKKELEKIRQQKRKDEETENNLQKTINQIEIEDKGIIAQWEEEVQELGDLINDVKLDYLFTKINLTNGSFEIKSSIEDVIPSRMSYVVNLMGKTYSLSDSVLLKKNYEKTYLQDFFGRDELYFRLSGSSRNNENSILRERLYLARLLLTDQQIKFDDLLSRFERNRELNYEMKKRVQSNQAKEWIEFPQRFTRDEGRVFSFLNQLNKIGE